MGALVSAAAALGNMKMRHAHALGRPGPPGSRCGLASGTATTASNRSVSTVGRASDGDVPATEGLVSLMWRRGLCQRTRRSQSDARPIRLVRCPNQNCYKELPLNQMKVHDDGVSKKRELKCPSWLRPAHERQKIGSSYICTAALKDTRSPLQWARFRAEEEHLSLDPTVREKACRGSYGRFGRSFSFLNLM